MILGDSLPEKSSSRFIGAPSWPASIMAERRQDGIVLNRFSQKGLGGLNLWGPWACYRVPPTGAFPQNSKNFFRT
jgi:hypothetical protein